ncbi:MAG: hypothetical protein LBS24_07925 [Clostridiales Family XIII bacterium]|jgi:hypothetical protein|nr:hypothetical protein [Clostridiales Family XIII bacterium]
MENEQLLPFERNRYYVGKLLTSSDFLAEQTYLNNKRRFLNSMMFGHGVVRGLGVYNLDDLSVIVESGMAIDGSGREIVLESAVIRKLSALTGFESITGDRAMLMLRYREELVHPTYSIAKKERADAEYEMNRVREGWELFLTEQAPSDARPDTEFLSKSTLYADSDYEIEIAIPGNVSCGERVKLSVFVKRLSESPKRLSIDCTIHTPAFTGENGDHELLVKFDDVLPDRGLALRYDFFLDARKEPAPDSFLLAKSASIRIKTDGESKLADGDLMLKVNVVDIPLYELIGREVGRVNLETALDAGDSNTVCLAELSLQRSKTDYIVEKIEDRRTYIRTMASETMRREYASYFGSAQTAARGDGEAPPAPDFAGASFREPLYATGLCEIPLGAAPRKGEVFCSDEIMHGLGEGNIYVDVGFEYITEDGRNASAERHTIYGSPELFKRDNPQVAFATTAVKVYAERGSFIIAAALTKPTNYAVISLRWVAVKLAGGGDRLLPQKTAGLSIAALTPTVVLGMRETHYFAISFKNMEPCTLSYELTEKNSGEISADGVYTAPSKEGVYEIRISCTDMPTIGTYAYAVVKKDPFREDERETTVE